MASATLLPAFVASTIAFLYLIARPLMASRRQAQARAKELAREAQKRDMRAKHLAYAAAAIANAPAYRTGPPPASPQYDIQFAQSDPFNERFRVSFGSAPGAHLEGLPACGGFYLLSDVTGVELDFLGLDRFQNLERPITNEQQRGSAEEEAFCDKMRLLGAEWLPNEHAMFRGSDYESINLYVGWEAPLLPDDSGSSGGVKPGNHLGGAGVWVLMLPQREAQEKGTGILNNARSMEERCRLLERLGAKYYEDPKECPDLNLP